MTSLTLPAFAKVNLDLRVLGTRAAGYHDLWTTFDALPPFGRATATSLRGPLIITCDVDEIPTDRRNLVWKAASLLSRVGARRRGEPRDLTIHIRKRIPVEAGLGGGSANAAVTLLA